MLIFTLWQLLDGDKLFGVISCLIKRMSVRVPGWSS